MKKLFKISVCFCLVLLACTLFSGCKTDSVSGKKNFKAMINGVNFNSLTEAVSNAKTGDVIKVYDDLPDHKNVVIDKPLTIKGVISSKQVKPKFYGSLTVVLDGEEDSVSIEDIDIVHDGVDADGQANNTKIGVNLIDGGINMKSSRVGLDEASQPDKDATGMIISRKLGSKNSMPIVVEGNEFGAYKTNNKDLSGALIIKRGGNFQKINLNEGEIYNGNTFEHSEEGNMFISIENPGDSMTYSYFVTSSTNELVGALLDCQNKCGSNFTLITLSPLTRQLDEPVAIDESTTLSLEGNNSASFNGVTLIVKGSLDIEGDVCDLVLKKEGMTPSIIIGEDVDKSKIVILH